VKPSVLFVFTSHKLVLVELTCVLCISYPGIIMDRVFSRSVTKTHFMVNILLPLFVMLRFGDNQAANFAPETMCNMQLTDQHRDRFSLSVSVFMPSIMPLMFHFISYISRVIPLGH
jgi:hypothetical protein